MESNYNMATIFTKKDFNFSCIYKLTSPSGKIYIGQTQCLYKRFQSYRRPRATKYLKNAILKYGLENITVEIIEKDILLEKLDEMEQFYLDTLQPFGNNGYNICREASTTRGRKRPKEELIGISEYMKTRVGALNNFYGKTHTEETKKLISYKNSNNKLTQKHIQAFCKAGQDSIKRKVSQIDKNTEEVIKIWNSIQEAADVLGTYASSVTSVCRGYKNAKTAKGYKWRYYEY